MQHIHFIGIAGSAIAPLAIMMRDKGWKVSGSDEGVYEPARSLLTEAGVNWYEGYDIEKGLKDADLVIIGSGPLMKDSNNIEFVTAKQLIKRVETFTYLVSEYITKENSIVVAGSYGKTTITGLLVWILEKAGSTPSFMIGGKPNNFESGVRATDSNYSVVEGDEFVTMFNYDHEPKFVYYKPKYALLTAAKWDHINVYPTEESYIESYQKLRRLSAELDGKMYICSSGENNIKIFQALENNHKAITYMVEGKANYLDITPDYIAKNVQVIGSLTQFDVYLHDSKVAKFETSLIGIHNIENILGAITILHDLGISTEAIVEGVRTFKGIMRRLDYKGESRNGSIIIEDFAHSAMKAEATLTALRDTYPEKKIIGVYNPRFSARENRKELEFYAGAFDNADHILIPRIAVKKSTPKSERIYGKDLLQAIQTENVDVSYAPTQTLLLKRIDELSDENSILVLMSASGWGTLIDDLLK